jgi:hypothetical protein
MEQDAIIHMRVSTKVKKLLEHLCHLEADDPSMSEMIRRLILRAAGEEIRLGPDTSTYAKGAKQP